MLGDRALGLVSLMVALAYIASATQIQTSFLQDPVGPKAFPILIGAVAAISSLFLIIRFYFTHRCDCRDLKFSNFTQADCSSIKRHWPIGWAFCIV